MGDKGENLWVRGFLNIGSCFFFSCLFFSLLTSPHFSLHFSSLLTSLHFSSHFSSLLISPHFISHLASPHYTSLSSHFRAVVTEWCLLVFTKSFRDPLTLFSSKMQGRMLKLRLPFSSSKKRSENVWKETFHTSAPKQWNDGFIYSPCHVHSLSVPLDLQGQLMLLFLAESRWQMRGMRYGQEMAGRVQNNPIPRKLPSEKNSTI